MRKKASRLEVRLSEEAKELLERQAKYNHISVTKLIEMFIEKEDGRIIDELIHRKSGAELDENGHFY